MKATLNIINTICLLVIAVLMISFVMGIPMKCPLMKGGKKMTAAKPATSEDIKSMHSELVDINAAISNVDETLSRMEKKQPDIPFFRSKEEAK